MFSYLILFKTIRAQSFTRGYIMLVCILCIMYVKEIIFVMVSVFADFLQTYNKPLCYYFR